MNSRCSFIHLPHTKRPEPLSSKDTYATKTAKTTADTTLNKHMKVKDNTENNNTKSNADHFLEMICQMKAEIIQEMDSRLEKMTCQMNQSAPSHQPLLSQAYYPPTSHQTNPQIQQNQACINPIASYPVQISNQQPRAVQQPPPPQIFRDHHDRAQIQARPHSQQISTMQRGNTQLQNQMMPQHQQQQMGRNPLHSQVAPQQLNQTMPSYNQPLQASASQVHQNQNQSLAY